MSPIPNIPIPEEERPIVASLLKDMRAALSYLSFYSADSPFVSQAVSLFHAGLSRLLAERSPLVLTSGGGEVSVNGERWEDSEVIARAMWVHALPGHRDLQRHLLERVPLLLEGPRDDHSRSVLAP
jgi:hypothetical protein